MKPKKRYATWTREVLIAIVAMAVVAIAASLLRGQDRIVDYKVIDGDTIHATIDVGWDTLVRAKLRLHDLHAPEKNDPGGPEATQALKDVLASGREITVIPTGDKTFDRWVADIFVDGENVLTHLAPSVEMSATPTPLTTGWQTEIQAKLDSAGKLAGGRNQSVAVIVEGGRYEFVSLEIPQHVYLVFGTGLGSREGDLVYVGGDNPEKPLITVRGGYGTGIAGCQIRDKTNNRAGLVGIKVENAINPSIQNIRVDLRGVDCIGLQIAGRESLTVSRMEARASVPVQYVWGDNIALRDCDLGATGNNEVLPRTCIHLAGLPHQITIDSTSAQGGDYLVYGDIPDQTTTGQILMLQGVRWEQSTAVDDPTKPGILIDCRGRAFEGLVQIGCRWSARKNPDTVVRTNPQYPLVPKLTELGNFKPKK